ncbi:PP2C family protein-serine/threonine phosphatase [Faecalibacterium sp. An122]|uniref:PP2C family protein-serine/threonine phosphatase n=1 Tax=Faecalibacterium sp. An122 TaxID=1965551 RepID=UPI000B375E67|nr:PP2C family protein-serine/threonine phosphatase [Faecalibacterium sp. An122]OUQ38963.1 stage II sporulation protein E [Faecalibacterium sp. An122]
MEKSFVGFGPASTPLPVREQDGAALTRRGQIGAVLRQLYGLLAGLAGGWAMLYGQLSPFALGLVLGLGEDCFAACGAGAVLALLLRGQGVRTVCLICAVGGAVVARWLWPRRYLPAAAAGCVLLLGSAFCFRMYIGGDGLLFSGAEAVLAAGIGFILRRWPAEKPGAGRLMLVLCGAAALGPLSLGMVNLGLTAAMFYTLVLACRGKIQPALSSAAVAAAGLVCADSALACSAVGLCCGTALGLLAQGDKLVCMAFYGGGALLGILAVQPPGMAFGYLAALGAGAGACLVLPRRLLMRDPSLAHDPAERAEGPQLSAAATRLNAAAESLSSLADTVNRVYEGLPRRQEGWRWVVDNTHDALCANCGRKEACWKEEYTVTMEGFEALRPILEEKQQVEAQDLPGQLARCVHPAALSGTVTRSFALYKSRQEARVHAEAMRTALTEQYSAVAQALSALGDQIGSPGSPEPYKSGRVAAFFSSLGMPPLECAVTLDDLGRTRAAVTLPRARFSQGELSALAGEVGKLCRRSFETPQKLSCKGVTTLLFTEKPLLRAVFGWAGAAAQGDVSGDAVQQFCSPTAAQMILCDGMGTGRPAAVDGNLAADLTGRLLRAGFTAELAARLVNVALALKSEEESGATLDLLSVDLYTGTARIFKAGAAPGFIVHEGQARTVGEAGLPVGVLGGVNGQSRMVRLAAGDVAVLVSDGLLVDGPGWVLKQLELSAAAGDSPEQIAQTLVETARTRASQDSRTDDITAAVLRLERY